MAPRKILYLLSFFLVVLSAGADVWAAPEKGAQAGKAAHDPVQTMVYELYAGGINAASAQLDVTYGPQDRYRLFIDTRTKGFLAKIVPWVGTFETKGWRLKDDGHRPEQHRSTATMRDESEDKTYDYGKDGTFKRYHVIENEKDETPQDLDPKLTENTTDALTAALQAMQQVAVGKGCEATSEVFDGDRRFRMIFRNEGEEMLAATKYNIYAGPAIRCTVEVIPLGGRWHSKPRGWMSIQDQNIKQGGLPTMWLAHLDKDGPAIPVKTEVKTDYGTFFAHLIHYRNGETKLTAAALQGKK